MLERMLIRRIEHRVIVGILCCVAIFLIVGWVALNEDGRMKDYDMAFKARQIEQGAQLYTNDCTICHGPDGLGLTGRAPALNNPQLFGHDFFPDITQKILDLRIEQSDLPKEQIDLNAKIADPSTSPQDKVAANARLTEIAGILPFIQPQIDDLNIQRTNAVQPAVDKGYDPVRYDRLRELNWEATRDNFILTAIGSGRPVSGSYWPLQMPAFGILSPEFNPPLRQDELEDLTAYVLNWDKGDNWTLDDLFAVNQFAIEPVDAAPLLAQMQLLEQYGGQLPGPIGTDVTDILAKLPDYSGDVAHGDDLYHGKTKTQLGFTLPCFACHQQTQDSTGPMTNGTFSRIINRRLKDAALAGYTADQYIVESITHPDAYVVPNFNNLMPQVFGSELSYQDLADIIAYLETMR